MKTELRLGNLLYPIHLDGYAEVIEIMVSGIGIKKLGDETQKSLVLTEHIHRLEPIELTEEWLRKFGHSDNSIMLDEMQIVHEIDGYYLADNNKLGVGVDYIKYVHQLQNLYFALTGEELIIKS